MRKRNINVTKRCNDVTKMASAIEKLFRYMITGSHYDNPAFVTCN